VAHSGRENLSTLARILQEYCKHQACRLTYTDLTSCSAAAPQDLAGQLTEITGFDKVSLQPNAGASGEYAGLMAIRAYHQSNGDGHRNVRCNH